MSGRQTHSAHLLQTLTLRATRLLAKLAAATTRLGNYTQIFKNAVVVPDTDEGLDKAGRAKEVAYQTLKIAKEQKLDIEKALFDNNARVAG